MGWSGIARGVNRMRQEGRRRRQWRRRKYLQRRRGETQPSVKNTHTDRIVAAGKWATRTMVRLSQASPTEELSSPDENKSFIFSQSCVGIPHQKLIYIERYGTYITILRQGLHFWTSEAISSDRLSSSCEQLQQCRLPIYYTFTTYQALYFFQDYRSASKYLLGCAKTLLGRHVRGDVLSSSCETLRK